MAGRLKDKVAVVTGAGAGIGLATALRFAEEGARVVANDLGPAAAGGTVGRIAEAGGVAQAHPADVCVPDQVEGLIDAAVERFGRLDVMHNNAGGARPAPLLEIDEEAYRWQIALNQDSVWFGTKAALRVMVGQRSGAIVTTSSGAGQMASPGLPVYGMAKAGVQSLMRYVAQEFGRQGIRANAICPGPMATPGLLAWLDTLPGGAEAFAALQPQGRLGTAEEIAHAAVFLASDEASYVNGVTLPVDGAVSAILASPRPT